MEAVKAAEKDTDPLEDIIRSYGGNPDSLISILQDVQSEYHYLPEPAVRRVASTLGLPLIQVYGVATFFKALSLKPRGKHQCSVCLGTACHVRGAPRVLEVMERRLGITTGETTPDMELTLESVNCLGACALGPIVVVDGKYNGHMDVGKAKRVMAKYEKTPRRRKDEKVKVSSSDGKTKKPSRQAA
jgi:NADH-quinone oxidoreductase subunit E